MTRAGLACAAFEFKCDKVVNAAPVYLTLPREVLAENPGEITFESPSRAAPAAAPGPNAAAVAQAADLLAGAKNPLVIVSSYGQRPGDVPVFWWMRWRRRSKVSCLSKRISM